MALKSNLPCPNPLCPSSDGYAEYEDGGFCFVCRKKFKKEGGNTVEDTRYSQQYISWRGIDAKTFEFFQAKALVTADGKPFALQIPYGSTGHNLRFFDPVGPKYKFEGIPTSTLLAGQDQFPAGSAKAITIYEGGLDAYSGFQMLGSKYPSVGVKSSSSAGKECALQRDYLNSFEQIYICFDNDIPGQKAAREVAKLFDFNKVFHIKMPIQDGKHVDVNDMLQAGKYKDFNNLWWNAKRLVPEGIISTNNEVLQIMRERPPQALCEYPWPTLQGMTYGLFDNQFVLIKAPTKIGKTEFISHIEYQVLKTTDYNIAVIHIEDAKDITPKRYATYELGKTCHLPDSFVPDQERDEAYLRAVRRDNRVHYYSHFGSKDPDVILDTIRFLVTVCGCKFVFLDHITLVISGLADDDERRALDRISTSLATMTNDLQFCCVAITHVNDNGQSRGSRAMEHLAHTLISLKRDKLSLDEKEKNTTHVMVEGNRKGGFTGFAGSLIFNRETWRMTEDDGDLAKALLG